MSLKAVSSGRKVYVRPKSRHPRNGLGFDRYKVIWRHQEETKSKRFEERANQILARHILRETDPQVFYQSPFIPRPVYDRAAWLPQRRSMASRL